METSSIEVRNILKNLNYPLTKKNLVQQAQKHGASGEIIKVLEDIPDKEYTSANDVINECKGKFRSWGWIIEYREQKDFFMFFSNNKGVLVF